MANRGVAQPCRWELAAGSGDEGTGNEGVMDLLGVDCGLHCKEPLFSVPDSTLAGGKCERIIIKVVVLHARSWFDCGDCQKEEEIINRSHQVIMI